MGQRRAFERMPANVRISFFYGMMFYTGVVTNVSQRGMFIRSMVSLPGGLLFPIILRREREVQSVLARVRHKRKTGYPHNGMGVELIRPPAHFHSKFFDHK
jgi:hypothetical protein